ncbi:hypothetical protein BTR19_28360 [Pseudomonas fluorescens]|nr:hypothetical protein BTR19_28360 [Pseudomonas fluorescens]
MGAGLARDAGTAVVQPDRGDAIAGKPAPTQASSHIFYCIFSAYWAPLTAPALDITKLRNCSTVIFWPLKVTSLLA